MFINIYGAGTSQFRPYLNPAGCCYDSHMEPDGGAVDSTGRREWTVQGDVSGQYRET
jgi:hypothetical protein